MFGLSDLFMWRWVKALKECKGWRVKTYGSPFTFAGGKWSFCRFVTVMTWTTPESRLTLQWPKCWVWKAQSTSLLGIPEPSRTIHVPPVAWRQLILLTIYYLVTSKEGNRWEEKTLLRATVLPTHPLTHVNFLVGRFKIEALFFKTSDGNIWPMILEVNAHW